MKHGKDQEESKATTCLTEEWGLELLDQLISQLHEAHDMADYLRSDNRQLEYQIKRTENDVENLKTAYIRIGGG